MSLYKSNVPLPQLRFPPAERDNAVAFFRRCGLPITSVRQVVGCGWARVKRVDRRLAGGRSVLPPEMMPQRAVKRDVQRVETALRVVDPEIVEPELLQQLALFDII